MYEAATATVDPEKLFENAIRYFQWYFFFWTYNFKHSKQCLPFLSPEMQVKLLKFIHKKHSRVLITPTWSKCIQRLYLFQVIAFQLFHILSLHSHFKSV